MEPFGRVARFFAHHDAHVFQVPNSRELRETASFLPLLELVEAETDPDDITFYGHTKGVTHGGDPAVKLWTSALHYFNLDLLKQVEFLFNKPEDYGMVGSLIRHGKFDHFPPASKWHYAGTFFWFRNRRLFARRKWRDVPQMKYGVEAYPSLMFKLKTEASWLYGPGITDLYSHKYLQQIFNPSLVQKIKSACS